MATTENEKILKRIAKNKKKFLKILESNSAIVSASCRAAKISRFTFYKWYDEDATFAEKVDDIKEMQKDFCEALILKKMKEGDTTMIIFYAKTQMKDRGYTERKEITGKDGEELLKQQDFDLSKYSSEERETLLSIGEKMLNEG